MNSSALKSKSGVLGIASAHGLLCLALFLMGYAAQAAAPEAVQAECAGAATSLPAAAATESAARLTVRPAATGAQGAPPDSEPFLSVWNGSARQRGLHLMDTDTGQSAAWFPPLILGTGANAGFLGASAVSPDGGVLAINAPTDRSCEPFAGGVSCRGNAGLLHLIEPHARRHTTVALPSQGWLGPIAFGPGASRLALALNEERATTLLLVDTSDTGAVGRAGRCRQSGAGGAPRRLDRLAGEKAGRPIGTAREPADGIHA